jgi:two-component system, LuxR family, response regulator FixJ
MHRLQVSFDVPTVSVVDPDPATGKLVQEIVGGSDWRCEVFSSGRDFLAAYHDERLGCLVLEQRIPDMSGLQLQHRLSARGSKLPLVFVTANTDVSMAVELMRGGAVHLLEKPVRPVELLSAIEEAVKLDRDRRCTTNRQAKLQKTVASLTTKECHVLELTGRGKSVKAIAAELGLSLRAIELRRSSLMKKLGLCSSIELMRFAVMEHREFSPDQHPGPHQLVGRD